MLFVRLAEKELASNQDRNVIGVKAHARHQFRIVTSFALIGFEMVMF